MPIYNEYDADSYDMPTNDIDQQLRDAAPITYNDDPEYDNAAIEQMLEVATQSGVDSPLVQTLKNVWKTGGGAVDSVSAWVKANPGLTSMVTSGIGNAQKQKYTDEQLAKLNQYKIDAEGRAKATEAELWDRRNQSVIGTTPAKLGILGANMNDNHLAYLQSRK